MTILSSLVNMHLSTCMYVRAHMYTHMAHIILYVQYILTTFPTEHTVLGLKVSAAPPLRPTATPTAAATSTRELTLKGGRRVHLDINMYIYYTHTTFLLMWWDNTIIITHIHRCMY